MITSTSNNFGAGTISLKDYQCSKYIVLQGNFTVDTSNPQYAAASTLEISVPDLSIPSSAISAVAVAIVSASAPYGTYCKAWVKNKNTICLEKIAQSVGSGTMKFYFANIFTTLNSTETIVKDDRISATISENVLGTTYVYREAGYLVENEHWAYLVLMFKRCYHGDNELSDFTFKVDLLPSDVTIDVPVFCCSDNGAGFGNGVFEFSVSNQKFSCLSQAEALNTSAQSRFLQFVAVRD